MNNEENNKSYNKIYNFFADGFKKSISPNIRKSRTANYVKERTFDVYSCIKDVIYIFLTSAEIIIRCFIEFFKITKNIPNAFRKAAKNNFKLGLESLKKNNLIDARIRFLLANLFYNKSAKIKYYIAYVYYKQRSFSKSLKYLEQSISIDSKNKKYISLFKEINNEIKK